MTLRQNQREWYYDKLNQLFSGQGLVEKYIKRYGNRYECTSPRASRLWNVFTEDCSKYGIRYQMRDIVWGYKQKYQVSQLSLFD